MAVGLACAIGGAACAPTLHPPPSPPRKTSLGLKVQRDTLDNGLRVVLVADPAAREVQVTMRYQVGAVDDPDGQAGLAHLVEHLMYQQVIGAQSVFAHLQDDTTFFNGETTFDATSYVARATPAHLDELLAIEATRASFRCVTLSDAVFERERAVVVNELRERAPAAAVSTALAEGLYPVGHPYRRWVAGTPASVGALTRAQACAFADAHYAPNNAVLVVSGEIDPVQVGAALKRLLVRVPRRPVAASPAVRTAVPLTSHVDGPPGLATDALVLAWPLPADPRARALVRALEPSLQAAVDAAVKGAVVIAHLGDVRAPIVALVIVPGHGETLDGALTAATLALGKLPGMLAVDGALGKIELDQIRQTAIYDSFAALEDIGDRDARFASQVLANQDPGVVLEDELIGLREMSHSEAAAVARAARRRADDGRAHGGRRRQGARPTVDGRARPRGAGPRPGAAARGGGSGARASAGGGRGCSRARRHERPHAAQRAPRRAPAGFERPDRRRSPDLRDRHRG